MEKTALAAMIQEGRAGLTIRGVMWVGRIDPDKKFSARKVGSIPCRLEPPSLARVEIRGGTVHPTENETMCVRSGGNRGGSTC